jgi:hypothetical protein
MVLGAAFAHPSFLSTGLIFSEWHSVVWFVPAASRDIPALYAGLENEHTYIHPCRPSGFLHVFFLYFFLWAG